LFRAGVGDFDQVAVGIAKIHGNERVCRPGAWDGHLNDGDAARLEMPDDGVDGDVCQETEIAAPGDGMQCLRLEIAPSRRAG
tara:strand:- start:543 stop:788 length:246 start_codon:yes stop_codon:yes gene_type:complete